MIPTHRIEAYGSTYDASELRYDGHWLEAEYAAAGKHQGLGAFPATSKVTDIRAKPTHILHVTYLGSLGLVSYEVINPTIGVNGFEAKQYRLAGTHRDWTGPGGFAFDQTAIEAVR